MSLLGRLLGKDQAEPTEAEIEAAVARELRRQQPARGGCPKCAAPASRQEDVCMDGSVKICAECMHEYPKGRE